MEQVAGFDWDAGNRRKCARHGVSNVDLESVFHGAIAVHPDPAHSVAEERFIAIGKTSEGRSVFLVFTLRDRDGARLIRPISARYMHRKEVEHYNAEAARSAGR